MNDAEFYQSHKDDESLWGPPEREVVLGSGVLVEPRRLDHIASIRFDPDTIALLRDAANRLGVTTSEYIRRLVWDAVRPPRTWSCAHMTIGNAAWAQCAYGCEMAAA